MRRLIALIRKETHQIFRDPSSILIAFVLPAILLFLYGYGVSLDANKIRIGLVVQDSSPQVNSLVKAFNDTKYFSITVSRNRGAVEQEIINSRLRGMVVIPMDFTRQLLNPYGKPQIQVITDGAETNIASYVQNYAIGVISGWAERRPSNIVIQPRFWFNPELKSNYFLLPGSIATIMTLIGALLTSLVIAREWERGTMEALISTPVTIFEIIFGKFIPYFVLGISSMMVCTLVSIFFFGVPFRGSFLLLTLLTSAFLTVALGSGLLISNSTKNQFLASQIAILTAYLPGFILSGFVFEIRAMPLPIQLLTYFIPARYFVSGLQTLFLAGDVYEVIFPNIAVLSAMGAILFVVLLARAKKRID